MVVEIERARLCKQDMLSFFLASCPQRQFKGITNPIIPLGAVACVKVFSPVKNHPSPS